jgi:processive rubber oxygenase RoxA-like protein
MMRWSLAVALSLLAGVVPVRAQADDPAAVERGRKALLGRPFTGVMWSLSAYANAWKRWDNAPAEAPKDYSQAAMRYYGLHLAPYDNGGYPMGLREAPGLLGKGLGTDCMLCHGGSIAGKSYIGLGNSALDVHALFEDLHKASGRPGGLPFTFSHARGTSEAASMSVFLMGYRNPDLSLHVPARNLGLHDDMCEDVPAWWLLKKKQTMYYTGGTDARSVRSLMQFMLLPSNLRSTFEREEATFRDIQAYMLSLEAPKYPFAIDRPMAHKGEVLFNKTCARCHGTYGEKWTYPNKIIPIDEIGTDRRRYDGLTKAFGELYNQSWFAKEKAGWLGYEYPTRATAGYQAPPLDGIWATAPYFHNGSSPTLYSVLNSKARPKIFTRSFRTDVEAYDTANVGWKVQVLSAGADGKITPYQRRLIYDTTQPGRSNGGHVFGDDFTEEQRRAVIEYLKTL